MEFPADLIAFSDADFASLSDDALTARSLAFSRWVREAEARRRTPGGPLAPALALASPPHVPPEGVEQWPVLLGRRVTGLRAWEVVESSNQHLVVTDLATGSVSTRRLNVSLKRRRDPPPSANPPAPSAFDAETEMSGWQAHRPFAVGAPHIRSPGRYALTAVYFDWRSNTVITQVGEPQPAAPVAAASLPTALFREAPEAPDAPGRYVLAFDVAAAPGEGAPVLARLDVHLPAPDSCVQPQWPPPGAPLEAATRGVLPATLLFFAIDAEAPERVDLLLPAHLSGEGEARRVRALGSLDVRDFPAGASLGGDYQVYLAVGCYVAGPLAVSFAG